MLIGFDGAKQTRKANCDGAQVDPRILASILKSSDRYQSLTGLDEKYNTARALRW